jgi:hypothetical protein
MRLYYLPNFPHHRTGNKYEKSVFRKNTGHFARLVDELVRYLGLYFNHNLAVDVPEHAQERGQKMKPREDNILLGQ